MNSKLIVSEIFYSIQGEGPYVGYPAVFLRLAGCNLTCKGWSTEKHDKHLGCDTADVWRKGKVYTVESLLKKLIDDGFMRYFTNAAHLVITGGEPLLQQAAVIKFIKALRISVSKLFIEIETNGTIVPSKELLFEVNHFNVSPKLSSGGDAYAKRFNEAALNAFAPCTQHIYFPFTSIFKFVISSADDLQEVLADYLLAFEIPADKVWLMPEGATHADVQTHSKEVISYCKEYGFKFSPRLHIHVWEQTTGV